MNYITVTFRSSTPYRESNSSSTPLVAIDNTQKRWYFSERMIVYHKRMIVYQRRPFSSSPSGRG